MLKLKTQFVIKLKNSNCDKTHIVTKPITQNVKNLNCDKTQKVKLGQNSNCDKT